MKSLIEKIDRSVSWHWLPDVASWVIEQAIQIQQVPAPTFYERHRALYVEDQFRTLGLTDVSSDEVSNVYGRLPGKHADLLGVLIVAHTDTVFDVDTNLATRRENGVIYGPGLGDNSVGVAGMLGLAAALRREKLLLDCDVWFVATSREEGLGDLGGIKAAYARLQKQIGAVINIEGLALGHVYHAGIAVRRLHITATTEGGHSWLHFGRASAIHGIIQLGSRLLNIEPPATPRTTYNIGLIEGGQSINSIASSASLWLDMRSEEKTALDTLEREVRAQITALTTEDLTFSVELVGDRPAGYLHPEHDLVKSALAALAQIGIHGTLENGSTDGNVPLAFGCPTVTVGVTRGGNAHRRDEYVEIEPVALGLHQLLNLTLAAVALQKAEKLSAKAAKS